MRRTILMWIGLAIFPLAVEAGELYRWVDAQGKVHYGDAPPPDAAQVETRKFSDAVASDDYLSYETRRAQQNFPVTLYVAGNCGEYCNQARSLLNKRGIPFNEKKLQTQEEIDAFKAVSGSDITPTLAVGKIFLKGFLAEQWQGELDAAGYPKTAPYQMPRASPAPAPEQQPATQEAVPEPVPDSTDAQQQ